MAHRILRASFLFSFPQYFCGLWKTVENFSSQKSILCGIKQVGTLSAFDITKA